MRILLTAALVASTAASAGTPIAQPQVYATGITASFPDPNGKVPAFNAVPGAGIPTWSDGLAQGVLTHSQPYNYCVSIASGNANGSANVAFKIARGKTLIQNHTIITKDKFPVVPNGIWYFCSGYLALPNSPGTATLTEIVSYYPTGSTKPVNSVANVSVLLQ